jgi:hypothetical protein
MKWFNLSAYTRAIIRLLLYLAEYDRVLWLLREKEDMKTKLAAFPRPAI